MRPPAETPQSVAIEPLKTRPRGPHLDSSMPSDVARMLAIKSENVLKALSLTGMTLSTSESPVFVPTTANPAYSAGDDLRLLLPPFWNARFWCQC